MGCDCNICGDDMKINIGPYKSDIIPVYRWEKSYEYLRRPDTYFLSQDEYTWYDKLVLGFLDKLDDLVRPLNRWSNSRGRKIKVHIDNYDVWSADHTLAMIIHPVLVKLKEQKHGSPQVDDKDVPEDLQYLQAPKTEDEHWSVNDDCHKKWEWVLDEMIWTFGQHGLEDDSDQFHHNSDQLQMVFKDAPDMKGCEELKFNYQKDPSKPKYWRDDEGLKKHAERKANGRRLFAKYYEALWD